MSSTPSTLQETPPAAGKAAAGKVHFVGLTGLRFLLAWLVLVFHIEIIKSMVGLPHKLDSPFVRDVGYDAVTCFFVLSGFLITYLLFEEKARTGSISVKQFYLRRALRIWPVYYLVILLGFAVLPYVWPFAGLEPFNNGWKEGTLVSLLLFVFMLPNVAYLRPEASFFTPHTWSIGVEEQFYIIWPLLFRHTKNPLRLLSGIVVGYLAIKFGLVAVRHFFMPGTSGYLWADKAYSLVYLTRIDCMAIGGLGAWWFRHRPGPNFMTHPVTMVAALGAFVLFLVQGYYIPYLQPEFKAVCFALVLLGIAVRPRAFRWLDVQPLHYLGTISYGIYMYHLIACGVALAVYVRYWGTEGISPAANVSLYVAATLGTILLATVSYEGMERPFIRLKSRFARVKSGV